MIDPLEKLEKLVEEDKLKQSVISQTAKVISKSVSLVGFDLCHCIGELINIVISDNTDKYDYYLREILDTVAYKQVTNHIAVLEECFDLLQEGGYTKKNRFTYGDIDNGAWSEVVGDKKIVATERYCSMADENLYVYCFETLDWQLIEPSYKLTFFRIKPRDYNKLKKNDFRESFHHRIAVCVDTFFKSNQRFRHDEVFYILWELRGIQESLLETKNENNNSG